MGYRRPKDEAAVESEPLRQRLNEALIAAGSCALPGVIAALVIRGVWGLLIAALTAAVTVVAVVRAFRLSLKVSSESVLVRNYWRDYAFGWLSVQSVGLDEVPMGATTVPAIAFALRDGRTVKAQATPVRAADQIETLRAIEGLAPSSVQFRYPSS